MPERIYSTDGYLKHKRPAGWGSLCPDDLAESPQALLDSAVADGDALYNVCGKYALRAQSHADARWHGHPIPWSRLPPEARRALIASGRLSKEFYLRAVRKNWGSEFTP